MANPVVNLFNRIARFIFCILNIFSLLIGLAQIAVGIYMLVVLIIVPGLQPIDKLMIILGIVLFFTGGILTIAFCVFAFVAAYTQSRTLLLSYAVIVTVIVILELAVGIYLFTHREEIFDTVETAFNVTIQVYGIVPQATTALDVFQARFECCGVNSPDDWVTTIYYKIHKALPSSCCSNMTANETCQIGGPDTYNLGCYTYLHGLMVFHYELIGSLFVVAAAVQLICVVLALWMLFYSLITKDTKESEAKPATSFKGRCIQCLSKICPCAIVSKPDVPSSI